MSFLSRFRILTKILAIIIFMAGVASAIAFVGSSEGVETRCYLRDEGEDAATIHERTALEKITLPQLFQYLEGITAAETAGNNVDR